MPARLEKITSAVRETGFSRHNWGPFKGPLKPLNTIDSAVTVSRETRPGRLYREYYNRAVG